ncbi:MAG: hypothetical protein ABSA85_03855 [Terracidiphilus sp.]
MRFGESAEREWLFRPLKRASWFDAAIGPPGLHLGPSSCAGYAGWVRGKM